MREARRASRRGADQEEEEGEEGEAIEEENEMRGITIFLFKFKKNEANMFEVCPDI